MPLPWLVTSQQRTTRETPRHGLRPADKLKNNF